MDFVKGGAVKKSLHAVKASMENLANDPKNGQKLKELLEHAKNSVPHYQGINNLSLQEFPVVNKNTIREDYDKFRSTKFKESELLSIVTSGSTGTPFQVQFDSGKKVRNNADTIYFADKAGFKIGQKLFYMKIWAKQKMNSSFFYFKQNSVPIDVIQLTDIQISDILEQMKANSRHFSILGYVSAMERICNFLDRQNSEDKVAQASSIITMSESLNDYTRLSMKKYFGASVVSRYSNLENGIIAQQIPESATRYLINTASYVVEILHMENDEVQEKGKLGRIVVTDLYNLGMPMIRYDTGDIGSISLKSDKYGNEYLETVEGRKLDLLYDTKGDLISSYIVYKNMWQYQEILQYQLVQETKNKYTFKINVLDDFNHEEALIDEFKSYLGTDAIFIVEYVKEIPLLNSGKRRKIVNNYRK
jgi:phenylacetate-CoA ligase